MLCQPKLGIAALNPTYVSRDTSEIPLALAGEAKRAKLASEILQPLPQPSSRKAQITLDRRHRHLERRRNLALLHAEQQ